MRNDTYFKGGKINNMAVKIMIADDHSMIREGLKNLLELDGDIQVIAEAVYYYLISICLRKMDLKF